MKHPITITLPKPCEESWDKMTPTKGGRHCAACSKTVIDFTLMSDGEILDIFKKAKDNPPCGHFLISQLGRPLTDTRYKPSFIKAMLQWAAAVVLLLQGMSFVSLAQQVKKHSTTTQPHKKIVKAKGLVIKGHVFDRWSKAPIAGIAIRVKYTSITATTSQDGAFTLQLPVDFDLSDVWLEHVPGTGFLNEDVIIKEKQVRIDDIKAGHDISICPTRKLINTKYDENRIQTGGPEVALTPGIYKSKPASSDTSRVQTKKDAMPTFEIALTGAYSRPTFWQRITKPFRRKVHKQ